MLVLSSKSIQVISTVSYRASGVGAGVGQVEGDEGARAERGTVVAVGRAIGRSRIPSAIVPWFRDVRGVLCGVGACGRIAAAGGTAFIAQDVVCDAADAAQVISEVGGQVDILHVARS